MEFEGKFTVRGTGKSYFFSEFSPYSTPISGGQTVLAEVSVRTKW
jgi:predicted ATP-dependent Lon-type protease